MGYLHAIKIEAIGDATKTTDDGVFRWCYARGFLSAAATVDPDGIYKDGLLTWPEEMSASVDFRDGRASSSSQRYVLRADKAGALWAELMRFRHSEVAELIADLPSSGASSLTIDVSTAGLNGTYFLEREAIKIDGGTQATIAGGFRYTVARAQIGTSTRAHPAGALDDKYIYQTPHVLAGRRVQLVRVSLDASSAYGETVLWSGVLRNITSPDGGLSLELEVDSALQLVSDSTILQDRFQGRVAVATDQQQDLQIFHSGPNVIPAGGSLLAADQQALFRVGDHLVKGDYSAFIPPRGDAFYLQIDVVPRRVFAGKSIPADLTQLTDQAIREVFSTRSDAPSNAAVVADNTLPLSAHPGKLILQLLTSTPNSNSAGPNGAYDMGVDCLAGDVDESLVDVAGIISWGDSIGVEFNNLYVGLEEAPVNLGALIQRLLTPLLSALVQTSEGLLTVVRLEDLAPYGDTSSIVQSQILSVGIAHDRNLIDSVDKVSISFGHLPGLDPSKLTGRDAIKYRRLPPGQHTSMELEVPGIQEQDVVSMLCSALIGRYHDPIPIISMACQSTADFEIGAVVKLTHPFIFQGDATRGASAASALIISRREGFTDEEHVLSYDMMLVGLIHPRDGYIAPSGTVAASPSPTSSVFTINPNDFTSATLGDDNPFILDVSGFDVGDVLELLDQYGTPRATSMTIQSIAGNQITLTGAATATPAAGDIVRPARYAQSVQAQKDDWIYVASASNLLGSDLPKTYRT